MYDCSVIIGSLSSPCGGSRYNGGQLARSVQSSERVRDVRGFQPASVPVSSRTLFYRYLRGRRGGGLQSIGGAAIAPSAVINDACRTRMISESCPASQTKPASSMLFFSGTNLTQGPPLIPPRSLVTPKSDDAVRTSVIVPLPRTFWRSFSHQIGAQNDCTRSDKRLQISRCSSSTACASPLSLLVVALFRAAAVARDRAPNHLRHRQVRALRPLIQLVIPTRRYAHADVGRDVVRIDPRTTRTAWRAVLDTSSSN